MFGRKYKEMYEKLFIESNEREAEAEKAITELQEKVSKLNKEIKELKSKKNTDTEKGSKNKSPTSQDK